MENFRRVVRTKKEIKALRNSRMDGMHERLENLDDDFAAIQNIIQRTGNSQKRDDDGAFEADQKDVASSKFAKSLKSYIKPEKKKKFSELQSAKIKGDKVYEDDAEKKREKKAARKGVEAKIKENIDQEVKATGEAIQRNVNYNIEKAKGIVRKRKKEDKNPRVKRRLKYDKMVKAHKTKVQEFQDGKSQPNYKGESTGIHTGLKRSTKLT